MIKNFKDIVILLITTGVLILLATNHCWRLHGSHSKKIVQSMRSVITLNEDESVTGLIGIIGGYIGGSKN
jgi:hypothetical protein